MPSSTYTKSVNQMSTTELRKKAVADGLEYYRTQAEQNPDDPNARAAYEQYCEQNSFHADPEMSRLAKMDTESLKREWETKGKSIEEAELESYRDKNAKTWIVSQPRYIASPGPDGDARECCRLANGVRYLRRARRD